MWVGGVYYIQHIRVCLLRMQCDGYGTRQLGLPVNVSMCTRNEGVVLRVFKDIYVVLEYVQGVQERRLGVEALHQRMVEGHCVAA
jgi:hypothetical protein